MKSYTDIEQSKKLAEILPIESADICFNISQRTNMPPLMTPYCKFKEFFNMGETPDFLIPCWSLAALLELIEKNISNVSLEYDGSEWFIIYKGREEYEYKSFVSTCPLDAAFEMVCFLLKNKEL